MLIYDIVPPKKGGGKQISYLPKQRQVKKASKKMSKKALPVLLITFMIVQMFLPVRMFFDPPRIETQKVSAANWYNSDWDYHRAITVTTTSSATPVNYQVLVTLTTTNMGNPYTNINADGSDIFFTNTNGTTPIDYWIESWDNTGDSKIWVEVPDAMGTDSSKIIYMYYGNAVASSASSKSNTFTSGSFTDTFTDETKINTTDSSTINVSGGEVKLSVADFTATLTDPTEDGHIQVWPDYGPFYNRTNANTYLLGSGNSSGMNYRRGYIEWNISSIPDGATIINTVFKHEGSENSQDCHIHAMASQPSISSDVTVVNDAGDGTVYADPNGFPEVGTNKQVDLGSQADSDLQANLTNDWFAIGIQVENELVTGTGGIRSEEYAEYGGQPPTLEITYTTGVYNTPGTLYSVTIPQDAATRLAAGTELFWNDDEPANTDVKYQMEYYNGSSWSLIPDADLSGNSTGFDASPIDISSVKSDYDQIRLKANLSATDASVTPTIYDWSVTYYHRKYITTEPTTSIGSEQTNTTPNIPTVVSPPDSSYTSDSTPTLLANYSDPDADDVGTTNYRISSSSLSDCTNNTNIVASGTSSQTTTNNQDTEWTHGSSIGIDRTYYWCAQNNDAVAASSWTEMGSFILETVAPTISLTSPADNSSTGDNTPTLTWSGSDATSGIAKYQLYIDGNLDTDNISSSATSVVPTNSLSCGSHTWHIRAYDNANNYTDSSVFNLTMACASSLPPSASNQPIQPKPTPENPEGGFSVLINNDDKYTNNKTVTLKLNAGADTVRMAISNTEDFKYASQIPYQEEMEWELSSGRNEAVPRSYGVNTVYAKFYTQYGVASEVVSDSIILKTAATETEEQPKDSNKEKPAPETEDIKDPESSDNSEPDKETTTEDNMSAMFIFTKPLKLGSYGAEITQLQDKLKELGFFPKKIKSNSNFGLTTQNAVKEYQKSKEIYPCGIVGPRTRKALNNKEFITNKDHKFTKDLKYNDKNEEVKQLQTRLRDQNFFPYNISSTGWFGPITQKAVNIFQKFYNLVQSGVVDEEMRGFLNR